MLWSFILAVALALVSYFLGGYFVKVALFTGLAELAILLVALYAGIWSIRRALRWRRGRVRRIPPL